MSMQNESKRRSPSIIARLMGLDGMPPQSCTHSHREPKSVENQKWRPIASAKARGKKTYNGHESLRRGGSMDEQRFKDVFEVSDAEKEKISMSLYQRKVNANLTEAEMAFIRQKFMEAKRLSTDEKLRYSKEFNETLEALDSNKDLLLKFLHHPDSLFTKHLPEPDSQSLEYRELLGKSHRSPQWHGGVANSSHSNTRCVSCDDTVHLSKKQLNKRSGLKPTEIVVLKPNLGKPPRTDRTLPSQSSSCDDVRADHRLLKANEDVSLVRQKSRDSRAIARIVSRQMKANDSSINFEISRFRGYAGDESSSWSDSPSESKLMSMISRARTDFNRKNHHRSLPSWSSESSVSKETMRRLSERWKLAHQSEQEIESSRRNTLAEMLATSDRDARPVSFSGISKRFESNVVEPELPDAIGISSRDGWKGTGKRNLSKPGTSMPQDRTCGYTIVIPKKLTMRDGSVKESSFHHMEYLLSNNSLPINRHFSYNSSSEINRPSSSKILCMDDELSKEKHPDLKPRSSVSVHADSDNENGSDSEDAKTTLSLERPGLSAFASLTSLDISGRPTEELDHSSIPQVQPEESDEEGDQPSPVSILQTSFHDEFSSSSNCFESLSADLQGLRMQLQLLKSESTTTYNEEAMLVSSDEDADQEESSIVTDETLITQEPRKDWKSLYLADVLANSRFSDLNPKSFMTTWHSSESPVDPSLFKDLEKKYSGLKMSTRLERKFLFDRINSGILEFFEQFTDLKPTKVYPKWDINLVQETLRELVSIKYMKPSRDTKEELQQPNLEDDIEVIGKEIEEMLTDELIVELVIGEFS
ncbi:unnamed protein product [Arabis nemorensis]|uniref:DUF4378 domain-containing protein n=1 Tax=Arabis nemorensis TaxID=586526 RepID=A0A565BNN3_9BRAS|nr:unnamed protein product [Arabis nemorensis]